MYLDLPKPIRFEWDKGNQEKSEEKHSITVREAEEAFFDERKIIIEDVRHSLGEQRSILLGKTRLEKILYIVFTIRKNKVRVISARRINKKEEHLYEEAN